VQGRLDRVQERDGSPVAAMLGCEEEVEAVDVAVLELDAEAAQVRVVPVGPPVVADEPAFDRGDEAAVAVLEIGGEPARGAGVAPAAVELGERRQRPRAELLDVQRRLEGDALDLVEAFDDHEQLAAPEAAAEPAYCLAHTVAPDQAPDIRRECTESHELAP
jgi:hypothetical protein